MFSFSSSQPRSPHHTRVPRPPASPPLPQTACFAGSSRSFHMKIFLQNAASKNWSDFGKHSSTWRIWFHARVDEARSFVGGKFMNNHKAASGKDEEEEKLFHSLYSQSCALAAAATTQKTINSSLSALLIVIYCRQHKFNFPYFHDRIKQQIIWSDIYDLIHYLAFSRGSRQL